MTKDEPAARPLATRPQVSRMVQPHLVALAAIGVAAAQSVGELMDRVIVGEEEQKNLRPKLEGGNVTAYWTEGVRTLVRSHTTLPYRVHAPYSWVELIFHDRLHVRMHRARPWRGTTPRQEYFGTQLPCPDLDRLVAESHVGNLELIAHPTPDGVPALIRLHARVGSGDLYEPITADPLAVAAQLGRWRARRVPWLGSIDRLRRLGTLEDLQIPAESTPETLADSDQLKEPRYKAHPRSEEQDEGVTT